MEDRSDYGELVKKLAEAEEIIEALRNEKVDAVVGKKNVLMLRLKESEDQLKKQRDQLKQYSQELERLNAELEAFSYSVSHDLKAPLRSLDGFSSALLEDYSDKLDERGKEYLNYIRESSQLVSHLIDDMLKLSGVVRAEMLQEEINLSGMVSSIADILKRSEPDRKADFIVSPDVIGDGDMNLVRIMLTNLLENAWKYTSKCHQTRIEFGENCQGDTKVYFVKDNGVGFDMQYSKKLFKPFSRLHSRKEYSGNGIGLATVYRIVLRHGGRIWAEAEPDKGATFFFTLGTNVTS